MHDLDSVRCHLINNPVVSPYLKNKKNVTNSLDGSKTYLLLDMLLTNPVLYYLHKNCTRRTIINKLKKSFSMIGVPEKVYSYNGHRLISPAFRNFAID